MEYINQLKNQSVDLNIVRERMSQNISDSDLRRYFGDEIDSSVIKYSQLPDYPTIQSLLPSNKSFKIILFENDFNIGHWILILRYNNTIEFFNSYGLKPNADFAFISKRDAGLLGQHPKYLDAILDDARKSGFKVIYNKRKFQSFKSGVNTCGRWIILRIIFLKSFDMDLKQFTNFVTSLSKQFKMPLDELVSFFIV